MARDEALKADMNYDPEKHRRGSIRLKGYDDAQTGAYFITVCTQDRAYLFGDVLDREMRLNDAGRMVVAEWKMLPQRFPNVVLDAFVVMPNHVHGVIIITNATATPVGAGLVPAHDGATIPNEATTRIAPTAIANDYEHVIRNDASLNRIRQYILDDPAHWAVDRENPAATAPEREHAWRI